MMDAESMNGLFEAAIEATEEAILNALTMADTIVGREGRIAHALPLDRVADIVKRHQTQAKTRRR
jgi:D-aminopeptidase